MSPPKVLIFTAQTGHLSLAQALQATLADFFQTRVYDASVPGFSLYYPFYRYFPQLSQIGYHAGKNKSVYRAFQKFLGENYRLRLFEAFTTYKPDVIISTYSFANPTIENYLKHKPLPFFNLLTDPWTISSFLPTAQGLNFVFDQHAYDICRENLNIPSSKLIISGWLSRPEYQKTNKLALRQKLQIPQKHLTLLVAAGSEGTNLVLKIIPTFLRCRHPLTVFVACGNNQNLYEVINNLKKAQQLLKPNSPVTLIALPFTSKLYQYIQASDLVIGKAGPNLLFETVACQVPFFAITHISGQEDDNLPLIKHYNLGYVEENLIKANRLLSHLIRHPEELQGFAPSLKALADKNRQAAKIIKQHLLASISSV